MVKLNTKETWRHNAPLFGRMRGQRW